MNPFLGRRRSIVAAKNEPKEAPSTVTLPAEPAEPIKWTEEVSVTDKPKGRSLCPVCNVKPNYYFHRKNCKG